MLALGVGGSALLLTATLFTSRSVGVLASGAAGMILVGFLRGEVVLLKQGASWTEGLCGKFGLLIAGLATFLDLAEHCRSVWHKANV